MDGRKPLPKNVADLTASRNSRALTAKDRDDIPNPPVNVPDPPDYLSPAAISVFCVTARKLAGMRVMTDIDIEALAMYAETFTRWRAAVAQVQKDGMLMKGANSCMVRHPLMDVITKAQGDCLRLLTEFGMTPSSRVRVRQNG